MGIPTEGFVFVRVISFHFDDGRTFTAVDTSGAPNSAIAATSNGDTSSLTTTSAPPAQINIVPASRQLLLGERAQLRLLGNQDASLSTVRIEKGYTQATQAGASVQRGIQATMHYNYQYNGITWQQIKTATEDYIATQHGEQKAHLHSLFSNIGSSAKQDITLTGDITAVGQSYIPTEGFVFVRVISFHFDDGRTFTAVDTSGAPNSAIAATSNGDTSSLTTTSAPPAQINIVPASRQLLLGERA